MTFGEVREKCRCLNAVQLKGIAMLCMLCDHIGLTLAPGAIWLRVIGRLAFPIFAFQLAEGFFLTRSRRRYLLRMFLFALLSEIPFNLMAGGSLFYPDHQNVMLTLFFALCAMMFLESAKKRGRLLFGAALFLTLMLSLAVGELTRADYAGGGIWTVLIFYLFRGVRHGGIGELAGLTLVHGVMLGGWNLPVRLFGLSFDFPLQLFAVLALIPIGMYNGRQGPHNRALQLSGYAFYPAHMLALSGIRWLAGLR